MAVESHSFSRVQFHLVTQIEKTPNQTNPQIKKTPQNKQKTKPQANNKTVACITGIALICISHILFDLHFTESSAFI